MKQEDYHYSITAKISAKKAIDKINRVSEWWTKGFKGSSQKLGDTFSVRFGETFVDFEVVEVVPDKKIVWQVIDCNLHWLKNTTEWNDTKIEWEISSKNGTTKVNMTHNGLIPRIECFDDCKEGWDFYVGESLLKLLTENKGLPDMQGSST